METQRKSVVLGREYPCPRCGYDLRAAVEGRCPECGTVTLPEMLRASRIPWVHRKSLGRVRAYAATVWMVVRKPGVLPREMGARQKRRDAESFHRVSVFLAAGILTLCVGLVVRSAWVPDIRGDQWGGWLMPMAMPMDQWWGMVPLFIGLWVGMRAGMGIFRGVVRMGVRGAIERRRAQRIALYASAILLVEAAAWGMGMLTGSAAAWAGDFGDKWSSEIICAGWGFVVLGFGIYVVRAIALVMGIGQKKFWRGVMMVSVVPAAGLALMAVSVGVAMWLAGYAAMMWVAVRW